MKCVIVFGILVLLVGAQLQNDDFPIKCYSHVGDAVYLKFICFLDQYTADKCQSSNRYDNSSVKLIRYECRSTIPSLTLYLDVLKTFINLDVLDISNLEISNFSFRQKVNTTSTEFKSQIKTLKAVQNKLTGIPNSLLDHLPSVTKIDYSKNNVRVVDFNQFTKSNNILMVNFSNNNIWNINAGAFANLQRLETLDLSYNYLDYFNEALFADNRSLKFLHLRGNPLKQLIKFSTLYNLQTLDISNSHIEAISDLTFAKNSKLIELNLANTLLEKLKPEFIASLHELETLDVSNTRIDEIGDNCFVHNPNMKSLNLKGTRLQRFSYNTFSPQANAVEVHLPSNNIKELDISCANRICHFKQFDEEDFFERIRVFDVSENRKQDISKLLEKMGSDLETLDSSWNSIENLTVGMLERFSNIQYLNLSHSKISKIGNDTFFRHFKLISLDLSSNLLEDIDGVKMAFSSLKTLNLAGNKLSKLGKVNSDNLPNLESLSISANHFDSLYLYNALNEWKKNGLKIDVELVAPTTTTQRTTTKATTTPKTTRRTTRRTTKKSTNKSTTPIKTTTTTIKTTSADSTPTSIPILISTSLPTSISTSTSTAATTTESVESSGKNTNFSLFQPIHVYIIIGGVFIIVVVIVAAVIWYLCRKASTQVVVTRAGTGIDTTMTTLPANEIGFIEPAYEEIREPSPMQPMRTLPSAYAVGTLHQMPHYENAPGHTTTLDRYQFQNNHNASLQSNEYVSIYHHYATVSKPRQKRVS